jgi:hypothetical protein
VNLCLPLGLKRMEMDGRIRDTAQDEGDECARVFSKMSATLLGPLTSETSLSMEGGHRAESGQRH